MTEIKNIVFTDCKKNPLTRFFCFINYLLPLRLKYANESFVALNDNIQQGLITLVKDTKSHTRFKITKLILEENSTSIANQLVNYVISRYRAMGAHAFYVVVDEKTGQTAVQKLFNEIGPKYKDRNGGYTRVIKTGNRRGDNAPMAILKLVD